MNPHVSIPREALAELLRASGSPLTPEQYLASLPELSIFAKYPGRAKVSTWSRNLLIGAVVIGAVILPFDFDFEALVLFIGVAAVTFFEFKVNRYFIERNPGAPVLGFRNQSCFAVGILIYGLYHGLFPQTVPLPEGYREYMDPAMADMMQSATKITYFAVGIIGGISQFALACYYYLARVRA